MPVGKGDSTFTSLSSLLDRGNYRKEIKIDQSLHLLPHTMHMHAELLVIVACISSSALLFALCIPPTPKSNLTKLPN